MISKMTTSSTLMKLMALMSVLNALTSASTLLESELNTLNNKDTSKSSKSKTGAAYQIKLETRQYHFNGFMIPPPAIPPPGLPPSGLPSPLPGCPLCDSSVYSYCSHKLIHDSCCCDFSGAAIYQKPPQCALNDCRLLYAKSCYEHSLIKNCCCNNPY